MPQKSEIVLPEWSRKIKRLRHSRHLNQGAFGAALGLSPMAGSRWERAMAEPSGDAYIRLGNLADDSLRWFFWERAGLRRSDVTRAPRKVNPHFDANRVSTVRLFRAGSGKKRALKKVSLVAIPLLPVHAGTPGFEGDNIDLAETPPESVLAAPLG